MGSPGRVAGRRGRPTYLDRLDKAVRGHFAQAVDLPEFLARAGTLTRDQRRLLLRQALVLMEHNYVHLGLKRAMHAVDPVQRLRLLLQAEDLADDTSLCDEAQFHRQLIDVFMSVRDLHTNYLLPAPYSAVQAFLPFLVEAFVEDGRRHYLVSHLVPGFHHSTFRKGVEVLSWNGIPIERAVLNNGSRYAGSNSEAHRARGAATLTSRVLRLAAPPDEAWVIVGYRTQAGKVAEIRLDWMVNSPMPPTGGAATRVTQDLENNAAMGIDIDQHLRQQMRKDLFAPRVVEATAAACERMQRADAFGALESKLPDVFEARAVDTPSGTFGYLRIRTFAADTSVFLDEFMRLLASVPERGLIIDVRGNGGGVIMNGELILQLLTPRRIEPEPLQFVNTALNLKICSANVADSPLVDLSPWVDSMRQSLRTGAVYSAAFPITDPKACNAIGQRYFGPVVLIVDALCYSTTDIFAAGFQDHEIGPLLGTDRNTGAGGANVWTQQLLARLLPGAGSVYEPLPNDAGMRVSMRRSLRIGPKSGTPVEELGVEPKYNHDLTRRDLLENNIDLLNEAGRLLSAAPQRAFAPMLHWSDEQTLRVSVQAQGVTRIDLYLDERPIDSIDLKDGGAEARLARPAPGSVLELRGFDGSELVARFIEVVTPLSPAAA